ncbi:MAG TPA: sigma-70 family RNA polymerase sigma factor [Nakamurella sp.]
MSEREAPAGVLYRQYGEHVRRYALRRVGPDDADDVTSEVFVVASRRPIPDDDLLPWLYGIGRGVILNMRRQARRRRNLASRVRAFRTPPVPDFDDEVATAAWVTSLIDRLSPADAELLRLVVFEDLDVPGAAAAMEVTPGAARTRLHRIRVRMEPWLAPLLAVEGHEQSTGGTP